MEDTPVVAMESRKNDAGSSTKGTFLKVER